jgi:hypothetical protein
MKFAGFLTVASYPDDTFAESYNSSYSTVLYRTVPRLRKESIVIISSNSARLLWRDNNAAARQLTKEQPTRNSEQRAMEN